MDTCSKLEQAPTKTRLSSFMPCQRDESSWGRECQNQWKNLFNTQMTSARCSKNGIHHSRQFSQKRNCNIACGLPKVFSRKEDRRCRTERASEEHFLEGHRIRFGYLCTICPSQILRLPFSRSLRMPPLPTTLNSCEL